MEVYIDDIVVKSKTRSEHAQHLEETFHLMKMYKMKFNPAKCAFGFNASKFMGFMRLIYYVSKVMVDAKTRYSKMEQTTLALKSVVQKLCPYFQAHQGEYEAKDERMAQYFSKVRANLDKLSKWVVKRIPRAKNMYVDALAGIVSTLPIKEVVLLPIYLQVVSSIAVALENYLKIASKLAHKIRVQAARFTLIVDNFYRRYFTGPYLKCLNDVEAQYVLAELHEGVCGNHIGMRTLAHHAENYVKMCDRWQMYALIPRMPSKSLIHYKPLAIRTMEDGHSWPPTRRSRTEKVSVCSHGLLQ
ncbi:hypothetical protein AAG906_003595 [Vitis piasezkii]